MARVGFGITKPSEQERAVVLAAGGVVWSGHHPEVEIALIHRNKYDDWSLPKGKLYPGEATVTGALREVWEETGVEPILGPRLATVRYLVRERLKSVEYWGMKGDSGSLFEPNPEVDRLEWLPLDEARGRLSYARDAELLDVFARIAVPVDSVILLVRHASAGDAQTGVGKANTGDGDDRLRALDDEGRRQAHELRRALQLFAPTRVVSADLTRCVETLAPLAEDLGVGVELRPEWPDDPADRDPADPDDPDPDDREPDDPADRDRERDEGDTATAAESLRCLDELARPGETIAVCAPGSFVRGAVRALAARDGVDAAVERGAPKGSVWALFFSQGRLLTADYYADLDGWLPGARANVERQL